MKKSELRSGMLVETAAGKLGLVLLKSSRGNIIASDGHDGGDENRTWCPLDSLSEDLTYPGLPLSNIIKVYDVLSNMDAANFNIETRKLIWTRSNVSEVFNASKSYKGQFDYDKKVLNIIGTSYKFSFDNLHAIDKIIHTKDKAKNKIAIKCDNFFLMSAFKNYAESLGIKYLYDFSNFTEKQFLSSPDLYFSHSFAEGSGFALTNATVGTCYTLPQNWDCAALAIQQFKLGLVDNLKLPDAPDVTINTSLKEITVGCQTITFNDFKAIMKRLKTK